MPRIVRDPCLYPVSVDFEFLLPEYSELSSVSFNSKLLVLILGNAKERNGSSSPLFFPHPRGGRESHMEQTGMLVGIF